MFAVCAQAVIPFVLGEVFGMDMHWAGARPVQAQSIDAGVQSAPRGTGHVTFTAEPQAIAANRPATLLLHFHVDPGFHINSHTPKSETLIPTRIAVTDLLHGNVATVDFPAGQPYSFAFDPKEKLDVYTGDFALTVHLRNAPGAETLHGALHYQACDSAACYPPKTLTVDQPFTAR